MLSSLLSLRKSGLGQHRLTSELGIPKKQRRLLELKRIIIYLPVPAFTQHFQQFKVAWSYFIVGIYRILAQLNGFQLWIVSKNENPFETRIAKTNMYEELGGGAVICP